MDADFFPDTIPFGSDWRQCNNHWMFAVGRGGSNAGRLFFRPNTSVSGVAGAWAVFGATGRPTDAFPRDPERPIVRLDVDNDVLLAIVEGGLVYRLLDAFEVDPKKFEWRKSWGWPFDEGPQFRVRNGFHQLCVSSAKEWSTMWTTDLDGNRHHRFIDHLYCLSTRDTLIHHNDPWTPGDWAYAFPSPERGRLLPARGAIEGLPWGINASGGVLGFIAPNGAWTIEYDFDIAGGNPLAEYVPKPLPSYEGVAPIVRFERGARPVRFPCAPWRHHGSLPGPCTAHVQVSPEWDAYGKVIPGSESRVIRVLGMNSETADGIVGYWEKKLAEKGWRFVPWEGYPVSVVRENLINARPCEYGPELTADWVSGENKGVVAELLGFGDRSNFFEPARLVIRSGAEEASLDFYAHVQMRTSRAGRAVARFRGRRQNRWLGSFVVIPEGETPSRALLKRFFREFPEDGFERLVVRASPRRVEIIKPIIPLNADIANAVNRLFGKRLAVLRKK